MLKKHSPGTAASRTEKRSKMEIERDEANRRADQAATTITLLSKQVADLTAQVSKLVAKLGEMEKRQAQAHQLEDSNEQFRHLFGDASSSSDPDKKKGSMLQIASLLGASIAPSYAASVNEAITHTSDSAPQTKTTDDGTALLSVGAIATSDAMETETNGATKRNHSTDPSEAGSEAEVDEGNPMIQVIPRKKSRKQRLEASNSAANDATATAAASNAVCSEQARTTSTKERPFAFGLRGMNERERQQSPHVHALP